MSLETEANWLWILRPFRKTRIRIDNDAYEACASNKLLDPMADAMDAQRLALASPELSLAQLAKREGWCRIELTRLLRLSRMSTQILDAIADGTHRRG